MVVKLFKWFALTLFWWGTLVATLNPFLLSAANNINNLPALQDPYHPFYVAVTEINQNKTEKTLEISCKLFAEDLESVLSKDYKVSLDLADEKTKALIDKLIPDYINKHLALVLDGRTANLSYIGFEKDKESVFCYFQVDGVSTIKKLNVVNTLLHDFNEDQINIIHVMVNGKRQSIKLDFPARQASFLF
jgi:hypothetical protein